MIDGNLMLVVGVLFCRLTTRVELASKQARFQK